MNRLALALALAGALFAETPDRWTLAQNAHFEVYSQTTDQTVSKALLWLEQIRAFFSQDFLHILPLTDQGKPPLRIIGFRSEKEYDEYRLRPLASAYYASDGSRDYIVMASLQPAQFNVATHEFSHYVLHASGLKLPPWLQEGLAEVFSTVRVSPGGYLFAGDIPSRTAVLQANHASLMPLPALLAVSSTSISAFNKQQAELFYAQSWALTDMLVSSPQFAPRFANLLSSLNNPSAALLQTACACSIDELSSHLRAWIATPHPPRFIPNATTPLPPPAAQSFDLSAAHVHFLLAQLTLISGHVDQAKARFQNLSHEQANNPDVSVSLGAIALTQGNRATALKMWRLAIKQNVKDPDLCYRYGLLADEVGLNPVDVAAGFERAVFLSPSFDDARYRLALVQFRLGQYRPSLDNLRRIGVPKDPSRRFAYYIAMSSALLELNQQGEAHKVALQAASAAQDPHDRQTALQLSYMAATDLNVQLSTEADGRSPMVTTRGTTNGNPFIEPSDAVHHAKGKLTQVLCTKGKLSGFLLQTPTGPVTLHVADPTHVLMRNSPAEFYCGPMPASASVEADYAATPNQTGSKNILRGMTFVP